MANAKVCDRCNAVLKDEPKKITNIILTRYRGAFLGCRSDYYDLCDNCLDKFYDFLRNKTVEGKATDVEE